MRPIVAFVAGAVAYHFALREAISYAKRKGWVEIKPGPTEFQRRARKGGKIMDEARES
jgi:DNA-binding FadR family transcriptional regulator